MKTEVGFARAAVSLPPLPEDPEQSHGAIVNPFHVMLQDQSIPAEYILAHLSHNKKVTHGSRSSRRYREGWNNDE